MNLFRQHISLFFLLAFLFPSAAQQIHSFGHEQKFHCDAQGTKHFHNQHHDCSLCDFVLPIAAAPSKSAAEFSQINFAEYVFPQVVEAYFSSSNFSSAQLRAPPVC